MTIRHTSDPSGTRRNERLGRILVVDDDDALRDFLTLLLDGEGYDVASARDGAEALDRLAELRPDLMLLDMMMPVVSGRDVLAHMRGDPSVEEVKVLVVSATDCADLGGWPVVGSMPKPFGLDSLLEAVEAALSIRCGSEDPGSTSRGFGSGAAA